MSETPKEPMRSRRLLWVAKEAVAAAGDVTDVDEERDIFVATCDDGVQYEISVRPKLQAGEPEGYSRGQALNPVTIRSGVAAEPAVAISRMHIAAGPATDKILCIVMHRSEGQEICAHTNLDEDIFVRGLRLLFPHGELSGGTEAVAQALVDWWSGFDDDDMEDNELVQELEPVVAMAQQALGMK
jgi:hypothetical protein